MKIGAFGKKFDMTPASVRYYIEIGLLIPKRDGPHYSFDESCLEDMAFIKKFKELGFHLHEISQIIAIKRMTKFKDKNANSLFITLLENKKAHILSEIARMNGSVNAINVQIEDARSKKVNYKAAGIPLSFISLFACPKCQKVLSLNNASIEQNYLMAGILQCDCGYEATIEEGILISGQGENENIPECSWASLLQDLSSELINFQIRADRWMIKELRLEELWNKTFITTDRFAGGFILENAHRLPRENTYIIVYSSKRLLNHIKKRMDAMELGLNILYVLDDTFELPLRTGSVDVFIDDLSTSNFLFFHDYYPIEKLRPYMKEDALIIGSLFLYKQSAKTIKNIQKEYPCACVEKLSRLAEYKETLKDCGYCVECKGEPEVLTNPGGGTEFSFHEKGDSLYLYNYIAKK